MKAVKYQKKSLIKLEDLLRRRKTTLKKFLSERGITTYQMLEEACMRLGVVTPNFDSFNACIPSYVSDPASGVIVVHPLDVVNESTGERESTEDVFLSIPPTTAFEENFYSLNSGKRELDSSSIVEPFASSSFVENKNLSRRKMKRMGGT